MSITDFRRSRAIVLASALSLGTLTLTTAAHAQSSDPPAETPLYVVIDMNPSLNGGNDISYISQYQNGYSVGASNGATHSNPVATLWSDKTPGSAVSLNNAALLGEPNGATGAATAGSSIAGISGTRLAGNGSGTNTGYNGISQAHALLWTSLSAASMVDLHPTGYVSSLATGIDGNNTVGYAAATTNANLYKQAILWTGDTAATAVDISPVGYDQDGVAASISGTRIGGNGSGSSTTFFIGGDGVGHYSHHALLWTNLNNSAPVDMQPSSTMFTGANAYSSINGVSSNWAVGYAAGTNTGTTHAVLWTGNDASTAIDLNVGNTLFTNQKTSTMANSVAGTTIAGYYQSTHVNGDGSIRLLAGAWLGANHTFYNLASLLPSSLSYGSNTGDVDPATGIITGQAIDSSYSNHGILWVPINSTSNSLNIAAGQAATLNGNFTQAGGSTIVNGSLNLTNSTLTISGGVLGGSGSITGNVTINGGTMSPGNSPGTITDNGNYVQTSNGTFLEQLGGATASNYDRLIVNGTATLAGTLNVENYGGFVPYVGETFDMLMATNGISGTFTSVTGLNPAYTYAFSEPNSNTGRVTVTGFTGAAAPEPTSVAMLALGALGPMGFVARRRRMAK